jgi:prepilin-type N-terminal cleavage/methylation domain-containing protein
MNSFRRYKTGFTLIEVIVVIAIIGLLSSIILVAVNKVRDSGRLAGAKKFATYTYRGLGADALGVWTFDDTTNLAKDTSQYNSVAATSGSITWPGLSTYNNTGRSITLNGSGYISVTNDATNNNRFNVIRGSIGAWIKTTTINAAGVAVAVVSNNYGIGLAMNSGRIAVPPGPTTVGKTDIADGKWHYVVVSFIRNGGNVSYTIYVDGNIDGTITVSPSFVQNNFTIGAAAGGALPFTGDIDDVVFYSQSLTASEVYNLYASQAPKYGIALSP